MRRGYRAQRATAITTAGRIARASGPWRWIRDALDRKPAYALGCPASGRRSMSTEVCSRCGIAADEAGWCGVCGNDLVPEAAHPRFSRSAQEREAAWRDDPAAATAA